MEAIKGTCENRIIIKDKFFSVRCGDEATTIIKVWPDKTIKVCSICFGKLKKND